MAKRPATYQERLKKDSVQDYPRHIIYSGLLSAPGCIGAVLIAEMLLIRNPSLEIPCMFAGAWFVLHVVCAIKARKVRTRNTRTVGRILCGFSGLFSLLGAAYSGNLLKESGHYGDDRILILAAFIISVLGVWASSNATRLLSNEYLWNAFAEQGDRNHNADTSK